MADANQFQEELALLIQKAIAKHKIPKKQIAESLKIDKSNITRITQKRGARPSVRVLAKIANIIISDYKDRGFKKAVTRIVKNHPDEHFQIKFLVLLLAEMAGDLDNVARSLEKLINEL